MSKRVLIVYRYEPKILPYVAAIHDTGMEPVLKVAAPNLHLDSADGLLLTGGTDVSPQLYGEQPVPETDSPGDLERDQAEMALIAEALEQDLPILAICRGLQILNVQHGGTLIQHLDTTDRHRHKTSDPGIPVHAVSIEPESRLGKIAGASTWNVNSRHHQAVAIVGEGLCISAIDPVDGVIEGLERPDKRFVVAVQWHPEDQMCVDQQQRKLFKAFAEAL